MRLLNRVGLLTAVLALTLPGSAFAETLTVDPAEAESTPQCQRATDNTCKTIAQALAEAQAKDTIELLTGTYAENVVVGAAQTDLVIRARGGAAPKLVGAAGSQAPLLTIEATGVTVQSLVFDVAGGSAAIAVSPTGTAALDHIAASRTNAAAVNDAVVRVLGAAKITNGSIITQSVGTLLTPAVRSTGTGGVQIADSTVLATTGPGVVFEAGEKNSIVRSTVAATEATAGTSDAVALTSTDAGARKLTSDSSIFIGGPKAAGVQVTTSGGAAGDANLVLRHVTVAGAGTGIDLDATQAKGLPLSGAVGNIAATVGSSIVHPASTIKSYDPGLLEVLNAKNAVSLKFSHSEAPQGTASGMDATLDMGGSSITEDRALFGRALRLRADAPVIDKGAPPAADESDRDVDGDVRVVGPASDIGADEFVSKPPVAAFTASSANPRQTEVVTFTSTSTDPDVGDVITRHVWDFGDGTPQQETATPSVTHAYTAIGTHTARLVVFDRGSGASQVASATITVKDGLPPQITITSPRSRAKLRLNRTRKVRRKGSRRTRTVKLKPRPLTARGTMSDVSGVQKVEAALTITRRADGKRGCYQYTGRVFKRLNCAALRFRPATLSGSTWRFVTRRRLRLPRGSYELRVRGTDVNGVVATGFSAAAKNLVRFSVR